MAAGRKRQFDPEQALETAMRVFWKKGFVATSINDLTEALGINRPSLYAAFGNKQALFLRALARYGAHYGLPHAGNLLAPEEAPLRTRVHSYLLSIARMLTNPELPGGCLFAQTTYEAGSDSLPEAAVRSMMGINLDTRRTLTAFFASERDRGNLRCAAEPAAFATYLMSVFFGMAVLARNGSGMDDLEPTIELATEVF
jgi:AcrR family transcriptional regulator